MKIIYKNKNIRSLYSFQLGLMAVGVVIALVGISLYFMDMSLLGEIFVAGGAAVVIINAGQLVMSQRIESISGITADEIDTEACNENSVWFPILHIYITENILAGFTCDIGNLSFNQTALKVSEIKKIYSDKQDPPNSEMIKDRPTYGVMNNGKYRIVAVAEDDKEFVLSEVLINGYVSDNISKEISDLFSKIKDKSPHIITEEKPAAKS